jgi:hypothetical protein
MPRATISSRGSASSCLFLRAATTLALALALTVPVDAAAKKKVAVIDFKGPQAAKAEKAVAKALKDEGYQIVGTANWKKAEKKAKAKGRGEAALAKTAKKADVSAIVIGKVQKKGKKSFLVLKVHDGRSGSLIDTVEVPLKGAKIDKKAEAAIAQDLAPVVRKGEASGGEAPPEEKPARREEERPAKAPDEERPAKVPDEPPVRAREEEKPARARDEDRPARAERDTSSGDTAAVKKKRDAEPTDGEARPAFSVGAGMSLWKRSMSAGPANSYNHPNSYNGGVIPGLRIDADIYPLAFFSKTWLADFGIGFLFDMTRPKSKWLDESDPLNPQTYEFQSTQLRWGIDLRWRWKFTDSPKSAVLKAAFQISQLSFKIKMDRSTFDPQSPYNPDTPDVSYTSFAPMVGLVVPLGTKMLQLGGMLGFLLSSESGAPAGTTTTGMPWGIELGLNLDIYPWPWLLVRAQFGLIRYSVKFTATAPATATSMSDLYVGGLITAAYVWQ